MDIPPWLSPAAAQGHGQLYAESARIGQQGALESARIAQEGHRLNQQYQLAQQEMADKKEQQARNQIMEQQQLEIEKSYKQQVIQMQQEQLREKQAEFQSKTERAARQFAAMQNIRDLIQQGVPEREAYLRVGPEAFGGGAGFAAAIHALTPKQYAPQPTNLPPGFQVIPRDSGGWGVERAPAAKQYSAPPTNLPPGFQVIPKDTGGWGVARIPTTQNSEGKLTQEESAKLRYDIAERKRIMANYPLGLERKIKNAELESQRVKDKSTLGNLEREIKQMLQGSSPDSSAPGSGSSKHYRYDPTKPGQMEEVADSQTDTSTTGYDDAEEE